MTSEASTSDTTVSSDDGTQSRQLSRYEEIGLNAGRLVTEKQAAYGDSFGKSGQIMRILYPEGIKSTQMDDALAITRIIDKLFRIATKKDAFGESPYQDIIGYAILGALRDIKQKDAAQARRLAVRFQTDLVDAMSEEIKKEIDAEILGDLFQPDGKKDYYRSKSWLLDKTLRQQSPEAIAESCGVTKRTILNWYTRHKLKPYEAPPRE